MHVGIFDLEHVKVISGHLVHFSENWGVTQKRLVVEQKRRKFGPWGVCNMHVGILTLNISRLFGVIQCTFLKIGTVTQKQLMVERNRRKFARYGCMYHACWYF